MEAGIGAASGLISSVVNLLSNELVEAYVASAELGLNSMKVRDDLMFTQGLLHEAQARGVSNNAGLEGLLRRLRAKADEAEDALDELHYFIIQDQLDGTHYAVPDLGDDLRGHCRHGCHAVGKCLACFSCSHKMQDDDHETAAAAVAKLPFDRVALSKKIKLVIEDIHSLCDPVSKLLNIVPQNSSSTAIANLKRPLIGSTAAQDTLYGRRDLFEQTIKYIITRATNNTETLSVLPIVGPGGIGKTTFTQHLHNDKRIEEHFPVRVWVCVSTDFDVLKLSQQILSCIAGSNPANQTTNLDQLQISIAQRLKSKRFLVVFDDIWKCNPQGCEILLAPFMKGEAKGNMVIITTRFPSIVEMVKTTHPIEMKGLEHDDFLKFLEAFIFGGNKPEDYEDDLSDVAKNNANKLKGSPLAAKTVGRLLKKKHSREHWIGVLENNEWQKQKNDDDIMPSLRISYDYLPFHLKKCFSYFALFPEDYRFKNLEITYFFIAIGIMDKYDNYMEELVDDGFLLKENDDLEDKYYILHDLLHELSRSVSSQECLNIYSSGSFRADDIPKTICHLSVTMENKYDGNFRGEMVKLRGKVDIVNLRSLMIFREYGETVEDILKNTLEGIEGLRVLSIVVKSSKSMPCYLPNLIHLRFLKISTPHFAPKILLPSALSRFYHLKLLDLSSWYGSDKLPKDISRLINLCHFFVFDRKLHSNVPEVGKMKCLKELTQFCVKKESAEFELSGLGELTQLGGELGIYNLEKVTTKEEAMKAKLLSKGDLKELTLVWGESDVLDSRAKSCDGLEPHPNLQSLAIKNYGGSTGPGWLCGHISIHMLKSLHLEGLSWVSLPPFGLLPHLMSLTMMDIYEVCEIRSGFGGATDKSFWQLKEIVLDVLPKLIEWIGAPNRSIV